MDSLEEKLQTWKLFSGLSEEVPQLGSYPPGCHFYKLKFVVLLYIAVTKMGSQGKKKQTILLYQMQ
jgi:hypothetical protein